MISRIRKVLAAVLSVIRGVMPSTLQAGGLGVVAAGLYMLAPWLGIVAAGCALCVVGWAYDTDRGGGES